MRVVGFNPFRSAAAGSSAYRPDIDGLRAIAVLSVVLYHLSLGVVRGGFVGVDIFFVISGYLIAGSVQHEIEHGTFSFQKFYERRIRRILPALFFVAACCTLFASLLFAPSDFEFYGRSLLAMAGFFSNIFFISNPSSTAGYFQPPPIPIPLLHMWSLSVEEQFYFFFPLLLVFLARLRRRVQTPTLLVIAIFSLAWSAWGVIHQPVATFYSILPRIWEFLVGAILSTARPPRIQHRWQREILAVTGLLAVAVAALAYSSRTSFPGLSALLPCLGAGLLLYSGEDGGTVVKRLLSFPPLVYIGAISYSLYLWHWPIIVFAQYLGWIQIWRLSIFAGSGRALVLSLVLAALSHQFVERPFRTRPYRIPRRFTLWLGAATSVAMAVLGSLIVQHQGVPRRFDRHTLAVINANAVSGNPAGPAFGKCDNYKTDPHQLSDVSFCKFGNSNHNILVWGDSHVMQLLPLLHDVAQTESLANFGIVTAVSAGCPASAELNNALPGYHCAEFNRLSLLRALDGDIDGVFIDTYPWYLFDGQLVCQVKDAGGSCGRVLSSKEATDHILEELGARIRLLRAHGKRVILALPFPGYRENIPVFLTVSAIAGRYVTVPGPTPELPPVFLTRLRLIGEQNGAEIYDPRDSFCTAAVGCPVAVDGVSIYRDNHHFANGNLGLIKAGLLRSLAGATDRNNK